MDGKTITIELELTVSGDECLTGSASDGTGAPREFSGWLGLVSTIDALLHETEPTSRRNP